MKPPLLFSAIPLILVSLSALAAEPERPQTLPSNAVPPAIELPFVPRCMPPAVSPDGKFALVAAPTNVDYMPHDPNSKPGFRIALVDLQKRTVLAERTLNVRAVATGVDQQYVYVSVLDSAILYALSLKDLSDVKRIFLPQVGSHIVSFSGKLLWAGDASRSNDLPARLYQLPGLTPLDWPFGLPPRNAYDPYRCPKPTALDGGWLFQGILYSDDLASVRMLPQAVGGIGSLNGYPNGYQPTMPDSIPAAVPWDITWTGQALRRGSGRTFGLVLGPTEILRELPAAATLVRNDLTLRNLVTADEVERITLEAGRIKRLPGQAVALGDQEYYAFVTTPGLITVVLNDRLYPIPTKTFSAGKYPLPLHFPPEQSTVLASLEKPFTIKVQARGGKPPLEYALADSGPGITIDKNTGVVTVDPNTVLEKGLPTFAKYVQQRPEENRHGLPDGAPKAVPDPDKPWEYYLAKAAPTFQRVTGRKPDGLPAQIIVKVVVCDTEMQQNVRVLALFADVPVQRVADEIRKSSQPPQVAIPSTQSHPPGDSAAAQIQSRIAELEKQNADLEAQIQSLKERFRKRPAPASRP